MVEFGDVGVEGSGVVGGLSHSSFSLFIAVGLSYSSLSFGIFRVSDGSIPPCPYPLPSAKICLCLCLQHKGGFAERWRQGVGNQKAPLSEEGFMVSIRSQREKVPPTLVE